MVVGEDVLRRPVLATVEASIDAAVQLGSAPADLAVVQGAGVADGIGHVARGARVRRGERREVDSVCGSRELARNLPRHVADAVVGDRQGRLRSSGAARHLHCGMESWGGWARSELRRLQYDKRKEGQGEKGQA